MLLKVVQRLPETLSEEEKILLIKGIKKLSEKYHLNVIFPGTMKCPDQPYVGYNLDWLDRD